MNESGIDPVLLGCSAALLSSVAWALGPIIFRKLGRHVSPVGMNLSKSILGILFLSAIMFLFGAQPLTGRAVFFLGISGILGIALGDTFFFMGLVRLGARLAVLMGTLAPVITVLLAVIFLKERPSLPVWGGIVLVISGVAWVLWERTCREDLRENWRSGIKFGLLFVTCASVGIIFAKIGVRDVPAVQATVIRLFFGALGLLVWGLSGMRVKEWLSPFRERPSLLLTLTAAVLIGTCIGLVLSLVALKYADASVAVPLNSTSPLFVLPLAALMLKEKVSVRAVLGALCSVCGIILIFLNI